KQNLHLHEQQAADTTQFMAKQLEDAKAKLGDHDAKLAAFQSHSVGALPDDEKPTLTLLTGTTQQLEAVTQSLNQALQDKAFTESMLNQQVAARKSSAEGQNPQTLEQQVGTLQDQLLSLQGHYTEEHPDVVRRKNEIADLQRKIQEAPTARAGQLIDQ